jgi:hypothetical protein
LYAEASEFGRATEGGLLDLAALRAAVSRIVALAVGAAETAYAWAGGTSVFDGSPLQRRWRDVRTAAQHVVAGRGSYSALGALLAEAPSGPV